MGGAIEKVNMKKFWCVQWGLGWDWEENAWSVMGGETVAAPDEDSAKRKVELETGGTVFEVTPAAWGQ